MPLSFPVSIEKNHSLRKRMDALQIKETDLVETFVKSGGKGGQNVNKVSTAVLLIHKPSGKQVKCSLYRTQGLNRYKARDLLCKILEEISNPSSKQTQTQKIIKQKKDKYRKTLRKLHGNDTSGYETL